MAKQTIWPFTGRVGTGKGPICPAQAPAQLTTLAARYAVLLVVTPTARPPATSTLTTVVPDEISTPRWWAALSTAAVSARGQTLRSLRKETWRPETARAGSSSASG